MNNKKKKSIPVCWRVTMAITHVARKSNSYHNVLQMSLTFSTFGTFKNKKIMTKTSPGKWFRVFRVVFFPGRAS